MNLSPERKLTEQEKNARVQLNYALAQHVQGNQANALKALHQALVLDPKLVQEKVTVNLAEQLTGLPAQEAFKSLTNAGASKALMQSARQQERKSAPAQPLSMSAMALIMLVVVMLGLVVWGMVTHRFDNFMAGVNFMRLENNKRSAGGVEYYVAVPEGTPPAYGWWVVVALHGRGGQGMDMMGFAQNFTKAGAIYVAPSFGDYQSNSPDLVSVEALSQILRDVAAAYHVQPRAILMGFSRGGAVAFSFSVHHPEQVYGVVTAGAPEYEQNMPQPYNIPYVFTWGATDGLQDFVIPQHVAPLQAMGYNIVTYIVPGYGHEMTPFAIEQTLKMMR